MRFVSCLLYTSNPDMVRASSLDPTFTVTVGLCLSNALTALSGAMVGQLSLIHI